LDSKKVILPAVRLFEHLPGHPMLTLARAVKLLDTT
jgi:hypothetical protein